MQKHNVTFIVGGIPSYQTTTPISMPEISRQCEKMAKRWQKMVLAIDNQYITSDGRSMPLCQSGGHWRL